jgi:hypothetical protein
MSGRLAVFDLTAYDIIVGGVPIKDGLVSAEVAPEGAAFADEVGVDGHVVRYRTGENRANLNIVVKGSSEENAKLSAIHAADVADTNGLGVIPTLVKDQNGTTLFATDKSWIVGLPAKSAAAAPGDVTWVIRLVLSSPLNAIVGGN